LGDGHRCHLDVYHLEHVNGAAMTVLTKQQVEELLAKLPPPWRCDLCGEPFGNVEPQREPYGPFTVTLCPQCDWKWKKVEYKKRVAGRMSP
jgi:hypothetical protein